MKNISKMELETSIKDALVRAGLLAALGMRARSEDIPLLVDHFLTIFSKKYKKNITGVSAPALKKLQRYHWPGNIRELKNLVQRMLILGSGEEIGVDEVEQAINAQPQVSTAAVGGPPMPYELPLREAREQFEKNYLEYQLRESGGSVGKLAKRVGMERTHLYRKLRSLGIDHRKGAE